MRGGGFDQNPANYYDLEMLEDLSHLRMIFEDIMATNALVSVAAIIPVDRLGIMFQFSTEIIRSVAQLHEFSIPGRITNDRCGGNQSTGTVKNHIQIWPLDATERCDVNERRDQYRRRKDDETNMRPSGSVRSRAHSAEKIVNKQPTRYSQNCQLDFYQAKGSTNELRQHNVIALENTATRIDEP